MDRRRLPPEAFQSNAAFIGESFDLPAFVDDILQVAPGTTNVAVVIGASQVEQYWKAAFRQEFAPFTNRVNFTWLDNLSFDQMLEHVRKLPPRSFIFLILLLRDASGVTHNADEALKRIHAVANAPVNSIFQHQLGMGIVGGRLYQAELEGEESARIAIRILHGEPASNFPPKIIGPLGPRYDWRELQRWKISEERLPRGSEILFREPTVWERHWAWIMAGISVCVAEALLIFGLLANLRKRRRVERSLLETEARFRIAADQAPVMIWISGVDKLCTYFNKPWLDFTGRTLEQERGKGWTDGVHPDDLQRCLKTYDEAFDARQPFAMEFRLRRNDGEYRWISDTGRPRHDIRGNFAGYIGSCVDITERKRADEKFRLAVEASPSVIVMVNQQGQIVLVNSLTERTFGYARAELLGQPFEVLLPERYRVEHPGYQGQFFAAPEARATAESRELFARRKDGCEFPVEIGFNPIQVEEGVFVLAAITDISERRRTELEAQQHRQELAHFSRVSIMGELSASMAHELNQPLTAILANAQAAQRFLAAGKPDLGEFREILKDIAHDTTRARDVIRHVRALVKKGDQDFTELDVGETILEVVAFLHGDIVGRNGWVGLELTPDLPVVHGDPIQLQQVMINLILNAFDAMDGLPFPKRRVTISAKPEPVSGVRVTVRDCGTGIPSDKLDLIFQPFYSTKPRGMGMGLSVTRSIVESHGGRIWAENHDGGGAVFHVTLPVRNGE
jgi:PAS domain S-box-containing protein